MAIVPDSRIGKITFYEAHATLWKDHALELGLDVDDATKLLDATTQARAAYNDSIQARDAAKAATQDFYTDTAAMATLGSAMLATIKSFAETTQNPGVYSIAQIPPPAAPSPIPAPGTPMDFTVLLSQSGAIELRWKCNNPPGSVGTIYECRRRIGGTGSPFVFIGASGVRSFTDDTLPSGSTGVTYELTAVRSTRRGLPAQFNVNFGIGGDGVTFARVENAPTVPVKLAA